MFHEVIDALPLPAVLVGSDERVSAANAAARALLGPGLTGRHYISVLRQPNVLDALEKVLAGGARAETAYLGADARGDTTWTVTVSPVRSDGGQGALAIFEDQTMHRAAGQMRRDFVANVSHELKTPLTALIGFIETLQGAASQDPAAREKFLTIMAREAQRMDRLVGDLLSLSRVEADERRRPTEDVDLSALVRSVVHSLMPLSEGAGVTLSYKPLEAPLLIKGDGDQLAQVATNLIENAIKYSGQGARVEVAIEGREKSAAVRGPAVVLSVRDSGVPIDPIHIPRLTERFYRIDSHRSREKGGTGLGLAIVKHIVNRHRGRLRIESSEADGNLFSVILPLV